MENDGNDHGNGEGLSLPFQDERTPSLRKRGGRLCSLTKLTEERYIEYLQRVRLGAYPYVAAGSLGISRTTWNNWMNKGRIATSGMYHQFFSDTMEEMDEARLVTEVAIRQSDPKFWLTRGPAKVDWSERSEISIAGGISVEHHQGEQELEVAKQHALAQMIHAMAELGFIQTTPDGDKFLLPKTDPSENVDSLPVLNGDGNGEME